MRSTTLLLVAGMAVSAIAGCSRGGVKVRTTTEPGANLSGLRTFYVLSPPARRPNVTALAQNDPMLNNSITNRQLRADLAQAFRGRGYAAAPRENADFEVAYYAGAQQKFDTTYWGPTFDPGWRYRYWGRRDWAWPYYGGYYGGGFNVSSFTQGQVIVDVTDPRNQQLLWRGQGTEPVSNDPAKYMAELGTVVNAIVAKFPQGAATVASGR